MSQLPPILTKGPYYIRSLAWDDRYVDLADAEIDAPIIGYGGNEGTNQQWEFFRIGPDVYHICSKSDLDVFVLNDQGLLRGAPTGTTFVIEFLEQAWSGFPRIVRIRDERKLYWTLSSKAEGTQISAKVADGTADQVWLVTMEE